MVVVVMVVVVVVVVAVVVVGHTLHRLGQDSRPLGLPQTASGRRLKQSDESGGTNSPSQKVAQGETSGCCEHLPVPCAYGMHTFVGSCLQVKS